MQRATTIIGRKSLQYEFFTQGTTAPAIDTINTAAYPIFHPTKTPGSNEANNPKTENDANARPIPLTMRRFMPVTPG